jgi:hypothetical protein
VSFRVDFRLKSYVKTLVASTLLTAGALWFVLLGLHWFPKAVGSVVTVLGALFLFGAAVLVFASAVVLVRYKRDGLGKPDLFLELNRSREPAAIKASAVGRITRTRRWLARHLSGHDLVVGDLVEVKTWNQISATLDQKGCLDELPFMPEMLAMCGKRARVFRCAHRLFDYRKTRRMRHMDGTVLLVSTVCDGSNHGGCQAACHTIWKSAWLQRVELREDSAGGPASSNGSGLVTEGAVPQFGTQAPRYVCQLTQLHAASRPIRKWSLTNFMLPLISGNVAPAAFVVGWLTHIFDQLQHLRQGVGFPAFEHAQHPRRHEEALLEPGDQVMVRSSAEIRATLNDKFMHRGLWFEPDMLKHCGDRFCVDAEIKRVIDIVTGEMLTMKTPAYVLRDVYFSGERQLFNAQHDPLFWRAAWLRRARD